MTPDNLGTQLHDRATRGEALSAEEQARLEGWYAAQDHVETGALGLNLATKTVAELQAQIEAALRQLAAVTRRIQELTAENEVLRREIAALRRQLAQQATPQPA